MNPLSLAGMGLSAADLIAKLSSMYTAKTLTEPELLVMVSSIINDVKLSNTEFEKKFSQPAEGGA